VTPNKPRVRSAEIGLLLVVLIWGLNFSVVKHALAEVPPMAFNAARFPLAAAAARMARPDRAGDRARRGEDRQAR